MKRFKALAVGVGVVVLLMANCTKEEITSVANQEAENLKSATIATKYIVVLKKDAQIEAAEFGIRNQKVKEKAYGLIKKYELSGDPEEVYESALQGFTVKMAPGQMKKMEADSEVAYIEADKVIALSPFEVKGKPAPIPPSEQIPWGITRVGGGTSGVGKTAWIIDSGIDLDHPDLTVDVSRSKTFIGSRTTPDDQNGHGTHVAGTIAAKDNEIGVIGVAAGATVVSVRVLDRRGSGYTSGVIAGVNYVAANGKAGDVANMSLGGGISQDLDDAVLGASAKVKFALAAGNESDDANNHSPARVNGTNIYTISSMGSGDKWAYFSNYGNPPIDWCAPGVSIKSTYKDGGYATMSGTSMAAPHVAGLLLLGSVKRDGTVIDDPDNEPDSIAHH